MLAYLALNPTTYVIVHKINRLARNRAGQPASARSATGSNTTSASTPSTARLSYGASSNELMTSTDNARRWADLAMDGAVTLDIAKTEQSSLARQLSQLQHQQKSFADTEVDYATTVNRALTILDHCGSAYEQAKSQERRLLNQSWFERILVNYEDDAAFIETADKTDTLEILSTAQVGEPRPGEGTLLSEPIRPPRVRWSPLLWS